MPEPERLRPSLVRRMAEHPHAPLAAQFARFGIVGVSNTLLFLAVYAICADALGVWYLASSAIAFAFGAVNGYLLNRRWTFRAAKTSTATAVRFGLVQGIGFLGNLALVFVLVEVAGLDKNLGQVVSIVTVVVLTFFANRIWTFGAGTAAARVTPQAGIR